MRTIPQIKILRAMIKILLNKNCACGVCIVKQNRLIVEMVEFAAIIISKTILIGYVKTRRIQHLQNVL